MNEEKVNVIKIEGMLSHILFPKARKLLGTSEDNSFGVTVWNINRVLDGTLESTKDTITITGNFFVPIKERKLYVIVAKEKIHETYGKQYELIFINENCELNTIIQQKKFLGSILTKLQLKNLFETYENPLEIIKNHDVEGLSKVHGIEAYTATRIIDRYEQNKDNSVIYIKLADIGLTPVFIQKLIKRYKDPNKIVSVILENPYSLTYDIDGIGFLTADKIALKAGISPTSLYRISSFIKYHLEELGQDGNSYISARELRNDIYSFFDGKDNILENILDEKGNVIDNNINQAFKELQDKKILNIDEKEVDGKVIRRVYLNKYYYLEKEIAQNLIRLQKSDNKLDYSNWREDVKELEKTLGFDFTEEQLEGIKLGLDSPVCFITGLAGSGKSTLVSGILASLKGYTFKQCALSGQAASRLQEVTGEDGSTIHRLLEYNPKLGFVKNKSNPLEDNIIILDELSLVGEEVFNNLLNAIPNGAKLIMLGDMGQLESIGEGNLAFDIYNSDIIPVVELTKVQRQAQKSGIITTAHAVRNQETFFNRNFEGKKTFGELKDMHFDISNSYENDREKCVEYFKRLFKSSVVKKNIMDIQLISPIKERGETCVFILNKDVQEIYNPLTYENENKTMTIKVSKDKSFEIRIHDKVMCIKNNYKIVDIYGENTPIFNGWVGIVQDVNNIGDFIIKFQLLETPVVIPRDKIKSELVLGYASTVHKIQGSAAAAIIGVVNYTTPPQMLTSQLLYTLITRAKKQCVIVGQGKAINQAIETDFVSDKKTFLQEFLRKNIDNKEEEWYTNTMIESKENYE